MKQFFRVFSLVLCISLLFSVSAFAAEYTSVLASIDSKMTANNNFLSNISTAANQINTKCQDMQSYLSGIYNNTKTVEGYTVAGLLHDTFSIIYGWSNNGIPLDVSSTGLATETTLISVDTKIGTTNSRLLTTNSRLQSIIDTVATEATLSSIDGKVATETTLSSVDTKLTTTNNKLTSIDNKVATETTLSSLLGEFQRTHSVMQRRLYSIDSQGNLTYSDSSTSITGFTRSNIGALNNINILLSRLVSVLARDDDIKDKLLTDPMKDAGIAVITDSSTGATPAKITSIGGYSSSAQSYFNTGTVPSASNLFQVILDIDPWVLFTSAAQRDMFAVSSSSLRKGDSYTTPDAIAYDAYVIDLYERLDAFNGK